RSRFYGSAIAAMPIADPYLMVLPAIHGSQKNHSVQEPVGVKHFVPICCGSADHDPQLMVAARPKDRYLRQALRLTRFPAFSDPGTSATTALGVTLGAK